MYVQNFNYKTVAHHQFDKKTHIVHKDAINRKPVEIKISITKLNIIRPRGDRIIRPEF